MSKAFTATKQVWWIEVELESAEITGEKVMPPIVKFRFQCQ